MMFTWKLSLQLLPSPSDSRLLWNPNLLETLHIDDDILGHPNRLVPMLVLHTNLVGNHLPIIILLEKIRCCFIDLLGVSVGEASFSLCSHLLLLAFMVLVMVVLAFFLSSFFFFLGLHSWDFSPL